MLRSLSWWNGKWGQWTLGHQPPPRQIWIWTAPYWGPATTRPKNNRCPTNLGKPIACNRPQMTRGAFVWTAATFLAANTMTHQRPSNYPHRPVKAVYQRCKILRAVRSEKLSKQKLSMLISQRTTYIVVRLTLDTVICYNISEWGSFLLFDSVLTTALVHSWPTYTGRRFVVLCE